MHDEAVSVERIWVSVSKSVKNASAKKAMAKVDNRQL
jgi:hypothetical protein